MRVREREPEEKGTTNSAPKETTETTKSIDTKVPNGLSPRSSWFLMRKIFLGNRNFMIIEVPNCAMSTEQMSKTYFTQGVVQ